MNGKNINISDFDYPLPEERIARFPADRRDASKLLVWSGGQNRDDDSCGRTDLSSDISEVRFSEIASFLPPASMLVFNNTRVVRARLVMNKVVAAAAVSGTPATDNMPNGSATGLVSGASATGVLSGSGTVGARIEILCLEPHDPADYERAFAAKGHCEWVCMVGNLKKWGKATLECGARRCAKSAAIVDPERYEEVGMSRHSAADSVCDAAAQAVILRATRKYPDRAGAEQIVCFEWDADMTFGQVLEHLGRVPIPPYLGRDSAEIDLERYQTVYSKFEGSVAAPTAGLHFTPELIAGLKARNIDTEEVTLHVGAGTFLPVKVENALEHPMHVEHFEVTLATIERLLAAKTSATRRNNGKIIAVGTTSVRTLESLPALAWRIAMVKPAGARRETGGSRAESPDLETPIGQFESHEIADDFGGAEALQILADHMRSHGLQKLAAATRIMITPGFRFRIVEGIVTNFHQPKSTLLLLVSAFVEGAKRSGGDPDDDNINAQQQLYNSGGGVSLTGTVENWRLIYDYALSHDFRFLSYGDSSLLLKQT